MVALVCILTSVRQRDRRALLPASLLFCFSACCSICDIKVLDSVLPFRKMTKHSDTERKGALKLILLHVHSFVKLKRDSEWLVYYCYTYITYLCAQFRNNCVHQSHVTVV